jgi:ribose 5-phosphate isomerase A
MVGVMSDDLKAQVGEAALEYVRDGMKLGIGTGSTAEAFIRALGKAVANGLSVVGVPTSIRTAELCKSLNIALTTLEETPHLDLAIDGADEIDPQLNLIKGGGGALLREKIVAAAADDMLVIADDSKLVETLGAFDLPIEVNEFGLASTMSKIEQSAASCNVSGALKVREASEGQPFITDGGHLIVDASFGRIADPEVLASALVTVPGVVEHGLFTGLASSAIVAASDGIRIVTAK